MEAKDGIGGKFLMSIFNTIEESSKLFKSDHFFIIKDQFPISPGHLLIVSNRDRLDYFDLNDDEKSDLNHMIEVAKNIIEKDFQPTGYNIGMNCGKDAGQTVMHFHCHVIPRYKGDVDDPTGGVRNTIPGKGKY